MLATSFPIPIPFPTPLFLRPEPPTPRTRIPPVPGVDHARSHRAVAAAGRGLHPRHAPPLLVGASLDAGSEGFLSGGGGRLASFVDPSPLDTAAGGLLAPTVRPADLASEVCFSVSWSSSSSGPPRALLY
ncbi:hypothetical protein ABZP36_025126 [Zizania latifolia]